MSRDDMTDNDGSALGLPRTNSIPEYDTPPLMYTTEGVRVLYPNQCLNGIGDEGRPNCARLRHFLGSLMRITLADDRVLEGKFACIDRDMNIVLSDTIEYKPCRSSKHTDTKNEVTQHNDGADGSGGVDDDDGRYGHVTLGGGGSDVSKKRDGSPVGSDDVPLSDMEQRSVNLVMIAKEHIVKCSLQGFASDGGALSGIVA